MQLAYRAVGHRERTVAELRALLERKRVEPEAIERRRRGAARRPASSTTRATRERFAEDKRELDRWGSERIARELRRRGVAPDLIEAAVIADQSREAELRTALLLLEQRAPAVGDDRERDRAWRLLIRRGYEAELAYEAVRRHERAVRAASAGPPDTGCH